MSRVTEPWGFGLMEVLACGMCGSMVWYGVVVYPVIM